MHLAAHPRIDHPFAIFCQPQIAESGDQQIKNRRFAKEMRKLSAGEQHVIKQCRARSRRANHENWRATLLNIPSSRERRRRWLHIALLSGTCTNSLGGTLEDVENGNVSASASCVDTG